jgi:hypothetical protein
VGATALVSSQQKPGVSAEISRSRFPQLPFSFSGRRKRQL